MKITETEKIKLKKWADKFFSENDLDNKVFDIDSEIDSSLTYEENKQILRGKLKQLFNVYPRANMKKKEAEIMNIKQVEIYTAEMKRKALSEFEAKAEQEFNRVLNKIEKTGTTETLEAVYRIPKAFTKMVALGENNRGFLLYGGCGLGKSYLVMSELRKLNKPFKKLSGHITSLELYHFLFEHRTEILLLDDINVLSDEKNLNLLKACLSDNERIVQYHTSSSKLRVPNKFLFEGKIILLLNDIPKNSESLKAVESRILHHKLDMNHKDKIKVIFEIAKLEYESFKELTLEKRQEIANWIKDNTSDATLNLNIRLLFMCYEIYRFYQNDWTTIAEKYIQNDYATELLIQGLQSAWCELTGKTDRTYRRKRAEYLQNI